MLKLNLTDKSKITILTRIELLHRSGTDWAMLLGSVFLLIKGAGCWSFDKKLIPNGIRSTTKRLFFFFSNWALQDLAVLPLT